MGAVPFFRLCFGCGKFFDQVSFFFGIIAEFDFFLNSLGCSMCLFLIDEFPSYKTRKVLSGAFFIR